jgi:hypothetical protein
MVKLPKTRMFAGKRYALAGIGSTQVTKKKKTINNWADFQRRVNNNKVRIVKAPGGYAGYMRRGK